MADVQGVFRLSHPVQRADVSRCDGAAFDRAADRDDDLALGQRCGVGEGESRQPADLVDLDHGHAGLTVIVDQPGVMGLRVIGHEDGKSTRVRDHVDVRDDVTVGRREIARATHDRRLALGDDADHGRPSLGGCLHDGGILSEGDAVAKVHLLRIGPRLEVNDGERDPGGDQRNHDKSGRDGHDGTHQLIVGWAAWTTSSARSGTRS